MILLKRALPLATILLALAVALPVRSADSSASDEQVGDVYKLVFNQTTKSSSQSSSGSSSTRHALIERVVALREGGSIELEFDLPVDTSEKERARQWTLPVRVLKVPGESLRLLNEDELAARNAAWLAAANIPPSACGHWVFTWTAIKIECDPKSVLALLAIYDLRLANLAEGSLYSEPGTLQSVPLQIASSDANGTTYAAKMDLDPDALRLARAEMTVAVAEMTGQPALTLEAALATLNGVRISGSLVVTIELDAGGQVVRRTSVSTVEIISTTGAVAGEMSTTTVERSRLVGSDRPS